MPGQAQRITDIATRLEETAARVPDHPALIWQHETVTYGELAAKASAGAGALQRLGIEPGERVAIMLGNVPAFVEAHFAVLRARGVIVPMNPGLTTREAVEILADSGATICIAGPAAAEQLAAHRDQLPALAHIVAAGGAVPGATGSWRELLLADHPERPVSGTPDDLAAVVYTSGTTGRPLGAMLSRRNLEVNQDQSLAGRFRVVGDDIVLMVLPLSHIYALNVGLGACVRVGATMVLVERFDPGATLQLIERHRVSIVLGAPPMYIAWLHTPEQGSYDLSGVRLAVSGAAPLPTWVFQEFATVFGIAIEEGYGLTEAGPSVASNAMAPEPRAGSVGLPVPGIELRLVDDQGNDVEAGDPGEIWIRGPNVFSGYWRDPEATARTLTADGWLRTGDIASSDADDYLYIIDRKGDLINVSGFNVYPREVERVLLEHEGVANCAVVGAPHPYTGEAVRAFVVPQPDAELTSDDLDAFCRQRLARYKCPESIELVPSLPHTPTGKVRRVELREQG